MKDVCSRLHVCGFTLVLMAAMLTQSLGTRPATAGEDASSTASLEAVRARGIRFLKLTQSADGTWTTANVPGITALCITSLLESGVPADDPMVARGLEFLTGLVRDNGGIYHLQTSHRNYETSISVLALSAANSDGKYDATIRNAEKFLRGLQWDEDEEQKPEDPGYGGAGYGSHQRPDLSNTQFLLEALKTAGAKADDPAIQSADLCVPLPESRNRTQQHAFCGKDRRWRFLLHAGRWRDIAGWSRCERRTAILRQHDLRRFEKHDLCGRQQRRSSR